MHSPCLLDIRTTDGKVHYFGAAAITIRPKQYAETTREWLAKGNVGLDAVPGTMPPSRAQIKKYAFNQGVPIESVNTNADDQALIGEFLKQAGVNTQILPDILREIVSSRKQNAFGFSNLVLQGILKKYSIDDKVIIDGHTNLVSTGQKF
jgi:hypothetical protein